MKALTLALILTPALAFAMGRPPKEPRPQPVWGIEAYAPDGTLVSRTTDRSGQQQAGQGAISDTGGSKVAIALAERVDPAQPFAYVQAVRSSVDQPDVSTEVRLDTEHKAAAMAYNQAVAAGASGNVVEAAMRTAQAAFTRLVEYREQKARAPKPDHGAISVQGLFSGAGAHEAAAIGMGAFADTIQAKERSTNLLTSERKDRDISTPADIEAANDGLERLIRLRQIELDSERLRQAKPSPAPPTTGGGTVTPAPPPASGDLPAALKGLPTGTYMWTEAEARDHIAKQPAQYFTPGHTGHKANANDPRVIHLVRLYGPRISMFSGGLEFSAESGGTALWKPKADSGGNLVLITPANALVGSATFGGETVSRFSIANRWRPHFRFSKPGGSYPSGKAVVEGLGEATISSPGKRDDDVQFKRPTSAPAPVEEPDPATGWKSIRGLPGWAEHRDLGLLRIPDEADQYVMPNRVKWVYDDADWDGRPFIVASKRGPGFYSIDRSLDDPALPHGGEGKKRNGWLVNLTPAYNGPHSHRFNHQVDVGIRDGALNL